MIKILRKIIDIIFWIAAVLLLILLFLLGGVRLFGYTPYVITSGSMIPVYPVGSVVYVNGVNPEEREAQKMLWQRIGLEELTKQGSALPLMG